MMQFNFQQFDRSGRFAQVYRHASGRPGWVWRTTLLVGAILFVPPIILLAITALLAMALVFMTLSLLQSLLQMIGLDPGRHAPSPTGNAPDSGTGVPPVNRDDNEGRENVRVIRPDDQ